MPRLILVPFDSGHRDRRMGAGPADLLRHGAAGRLGAAEVRTVESEGSYEDVQRAVADEVARAVADGVAPVVLSGNCGASAGVVASMDTDGDLAVVWLDAHGDLNTPETTTSGFVDGMALAMLTGRCRTAIPGLRPVPEEQVLLVGARDLDPAEREVLAGSAIRLLPARAAEGLWWTCGPGCGECTCMSTWTCTFRRTAERTSTRSQVAAAGSEGSAAELSTAAYDCG